MSEHNGTRPERRRSILITGGAGFVGTNLADHFASRGDRIVVYDDLSRDGVEANLQWLKATHGDRVDVRVEDVRDAEPLSATVREVDAIFHLAAQVAVTTSVRDPVEDFEVNARGTLNVLEAARACDDPPAVIFTSTNKVYGNLLDLDVSLAGSRYRPDRLDARRGISEDRPLDFHSPYGCSKGCADQYVLDYARLYDIPATVVRMSCIYGPHQHGNEDQGWVAHFLMRAIRGEPTTIFGDGKQVRDVLYVDDLVRAFGGLLERIDDVRGRAFNLGGGRGNSTSLLELLELVGEIQGSPVDLRFDAWRPGDQRWYVSDTRALEERIGWRPRVGVEEGVRRLHRWLVREMAPGTRSSPVRAAAV